MRNRTITKLIEDLFSWYDMKDSINVYRVACDLQNNTMPQHDQVMDACAQLRLNHDNHADSTADRLMAYYQKITRGSNIPY